MPDPRRRPWTPLSWARTSPSSRWSACSGTRSSSSCARLATSATCSSSSWPASATRRRAATHDGLADGVVYSRSGLTYQAGLLEKAGLVTRTAAPDDERSITVTITDAGRALLAKVFPGHIEVIRDLLFEPLSRDDIVALGRSAGAGARPHALGAAALGGAPQA